MKKVTTLPALVRSFDLSLVKTWIAHIKLFFLTPSSALPFVYLRVGVALVLLFKTWREWENWLDIYGNQGMVPWVISEVIRSPLAPTINMFSQLGQHWGITETGTVFTILTLFILGLLGLLTGIQPRISALLAWFTHFTLTSSAAFTSYGVDMFAHIALFYCVVMPQGYFSLAKNPEGQGTTYARLCLRLLQFHMCVVYLSAGVEKCFGDQWWNGEAIWRAMMMPQFSVFDMSWLANYPWIPFTAGLGTLILEVGYCLLIWPPKMRPIWLSLIISLHLGIGLFLGLWAFAFMMIVLNLAAFGSEYVASFLVTTKQWTQSLKRRSTAPASNFPPI